MLKLEDNPPAVFPEVSDITDIYGDWWVARTKSRSEKVLAQILCRREIPYFLPLVEKISKRRGRRIKSLLPLFSGYLFFCGDQETRHQVLTTNKTAQLLDVVDQDTFVHDLSQIHRALNAGLPIDPHPELTPGKRCRVIAGPLEGAEGILLRRKNLVRILLQVEILGQAAAVEIDADFLEIVGGDGND
jgi:transcriptional antiterminator RfaH